MVQAELRRCFRQWGRPVSLRVDNGFWHENGARLRARFDTWLAQDYLFVADLLQFQARLLARAPRMAQTVLAAGAATLVVPLSSRHGECSVDFVVRHTAVPGHGDTRVLGAHFLSFTHTR